MVIYLPGQSVEEGPVLGIDTGDADGVTVVPFKHDLLIVRSRQSQ